MINTEKVRDTQLKWLHIHGSDDGNHVRIIFKDASHSSIVVTTITRRKMRFSTGW